MTKQYRRFFFLFLALGTGLFSCQRATILSITIQGIGLQGNSALPPIFANFQFFDPEQGIPFNTLEASATSANGLVQGETFEINLNLQGGKINMEVAAAVLDPNRQVLGAARTLVNLTVGTRNTLILDFQAPGCGDGFFDFRNEECDDGGFLGNCPDLCFFDRCGDGIIDVPLEDCDQGSERNGLLGEGCSTTCLLDPGLVFGANRIETEPAPKIPFVVPSANEGLPEIAIIDLDGSARLFPVSQNSSLLGFASDPLQTTLKIDHIDAADLDGDATPEIFALDSEARELHIFSRNNTTVKPLSVISLLDPDTQEALLVKTFALFPVSKNAPRLVLTTDTELFDIPFVDGAYLLANATRTLLDKTPSRILVGDFTGDTLPDLAGIADTSIVLFEGIPDAFNPIAIRDFSCDTDNTTLPLIDLDTLSLSPTENSILLATRSDGKLCLFQTGTPDNILEFFVGTSAQSSTVLQSESQIRIVVARQDGPLATLFTLEDFIEPEETIQISLGPTTGFAVSLDLDQNGGDELITVIPERSEISIYLGDEKGQLHVPSGRQEATAPRALLLADLDLDNQIDLHVVTETELEFFPAISLAIKDPASSIEAPIEANSIRVLDRDFDFLPDLAVPSPSTGTIAIFLGDGTGGFRDQESLFLGGDFGPLDLSVGEFNGEPGIDWAVVYDDLSGPSIGDGGLLLYSNVVGPLGTPKEIDLGAPGASRVEGRDLNFDFIREIIVPLGAGNGFAQVDHFTGSPVTLFAPISDPCNPVVALPIDASEEGRDDVVVLCQESGDIVVFNNPGLGLPEVPLRAPLVGGDANTAVVGDFNGDSFFDIAGANSDGRIAIVLGKGDGSFSPPFSLPASIEVSSLAAGDIDNDGKAEIFFGDKDGRVIGIWGRGL